MKFLPKKSTQYTFYIAFYWLILWIFSSVIIYILVRENSLNGVVPKKDCIRENSQKECTLYSRNYYVPVKEEAEIQIVASGIIIGAFVMIGGFSQMVLKTMKK
jgi:hypothetical protein